jgi:hypothetical protein
LPGRYELIYGFKHCTGETVYSAGFAGTQEEAADWVRSRGAETIPSVALPENDPVCTCEASFCPLKTQRPWFSFREI